MPPAEDAHKQNPPDIAMVTIKIECLHIINAIIELTNMYNRKECASGRDSYGIRTPFGDLRRRSYRRKSRSLPHLLAPACRSSWSQGIPYVCRQDFFLTHVAVVSLAAPMALAYDTRRRLEDPGSTARSVR